MASETFINEHGHRVTVRASRDITLPGIISIHISAEGSEDTVELGLTPMESQALRRVIVRQAKEARRHDSKAEH